MGEEKKKVPAKEEAKVSGEQAKPTAEPTEAPQPADETVEAQAPTGEEPSAPEGGEGAPEAAEPKEAPSRPAKAVPEGQHYFWGTGRRKQAVARVRIRPGTGNILINKREVDEYFTQDRDRNGVRLPLQTVNMVKSWDVWVNVGGGGYNGQAGAVTLGLARAIAKAMPELESMLRGHRLLTRDARMKERKKYGQKGARKRFQFSKR